MSNSDVSKQCLACTVLYDWAEGVTQGRVCFGPTLTGGDILVTSETCFLQKRQMIRKTKMKEKFFRSPPSTQNSA